MRIIRTSKRFMFMALIFFFALGPVSLFAPLCAPLFANDGLSQREHRDLINAGISHLVNLQNEVGTETYLAAMTALSGLAILGGGYSPRRGPYQEALTRITHELVRSQREDGWISMGDQQSMYGHGYATLFLAQIYGQTFENRVGVALRKAVDFIASHQSPRGGWNYEPDGGDEGSVTIVQIQALRAAREAGISVPVETIQRSVEFIRASQYANGAIAYQPGPSGNETVALTAQGMSVLFNAGEYAVDEVKQKGFSYLDENISYTPNGRHFLYTHFYVAQVQKQRGEVYFRNYYPRIEGTLVPLLQRALREKLYSLEIGHLYTVAMILLVLETRLDYLPIFTD